MSHTLCDVKNFFQLDFNNPAVNTFFTATKIFLQSRFINGWYIGKNILRLYFINLALPPFGQTKKIFTRKLYNSRNTPIVCNEKTFFNFLVSISNISLSCVHHLNTREYFYVKILSTSRVQHLNSSKKSKAHFICTNWQIVNINFNNILMW